MRTLFGKVFGGGTEECVAEQGGPPSDVKLPLDGAKGQVLDDGASPATTRAPEGSPGVGLTPSTTMSTPGARGSPDSGFSSLKVKNTFLMTLEESDDAEATKMENRCSRSLPASPLATPPGLQGGETGESVDAEEADDKVGSLSSSPTAMAQPRLWPNTMSGETLEQMCAGLAPHCGPSPKGAATTQPDASPAGANKFQKPTFWPRTLSGDDLEAELANIVANSPLEIQSIPKHGAGSAVFLPMANKEITQGAEGAPEGSPKAKFAEWPRTMSGDDLEELARAAQQVLFGSTPAAFSGGVSPAAFGGVSPAAFSNAPACLSTKPPPAAEPAAEPPLATPEGSPATKAAPPPMPPMDAAPVFEEAALPPPPEADAPVTPKKTVSIADTLPEPELGSEARPTVGSWGHGVAKCKPCAFFHTKGCTNGVECPFCHLCSRGEKKRRQREKWQAIRAADAATNAAAQHAALAASFSPMGVPSPAWIPGMQFMPPPPYPGMPLSTMPMGQSG